MNRPTRADALRSWRDMVASHATPDTRRGVIQLLTTALPFLALAGAILYGVDNGWWPALALTVPAAGFLVRLFAIQHDCGHGSFFKARWANDLLGRAIGVLTLTPYTFWRTNHAVHHAASGNLDRRGVGDVNTWTVREYLSRPRWKRMLYRLYRHPLVMFGLGPTFLFFIRHRFHIGHPLREWRMWLSVLGTNTAIAAVLIVMGFTVGLGPFLLSYLPIMLLAASIGVWLFYVQHQFEHTYWDRTPNWSYRAAAVEGSSFYDLPRFLHWVTGYLGMHHIHHLQSRIPNYRLRACFEAHAELRNVPRLTLLSSLRCARLALWDEDSRRLISFRVARQQARAGAHS
jgi:acyl-lipid omega-6 desaturase (Delta-12 desaturase)